VTIKVRRAMEIGSIAVEGKEREQEQEQGVNCC
jgi:hypothetical protein